MKDPLGRWRERVFRSTGSPAKGGPKPPICQEFQFFGPEPVKNNALLIKYILAKNALFYNFLIMKRASSIELSRWVESDGRKPLIVRGARQVGKTWLVRDLARARGLDLVEINFEQNPLAARWFASNDPHRILGELSLAVGRDVVPGKSLLFLDEIQAGRTVLATLRWFAEQLPGLAVVAAGSLLDFALAEATTRVPVGRVSYLHLEPMSFPEYLQAHGQDRLLEVLWSWSPGEEPSLAGHEAASSWFERFVMVGGMPAVVAADVDQDDPRECRRLQTDLITTFRDDFARYAGRMDPLILDHVLLAVASMLGRRFVAARVGEGVKQHQASRALELLCQARLCHRVLHSAANGVPLGGEINPRMRKVLLLDVGMAHALLGTPAPPLRIDIERALEWFEIQQDLQLAPAQREALRRALPKVSVG